MGVGRLVGSVEYNRCVCGRQGVCVCVCVCVGRHGGCSPALFYGAFQGNSGGHKDHIKVSLSNLT